MNQRLVVFLLLLLLLISSRAYTNLLEHDYPDTIQNHCIIESMDLLEILLLLPMIYSASNYNISLGHSIKLAICNLVHPSLIRHLWENHIRIPTTEYCKKKRKYKQMKQFLNEEFFFIQFFTT